MPQLIFESYVEDNNSNSNYDGEQVSYELGTSTGVAGNGSVLDNVNQTTGQYDEGYLSSADPAYFTQLGQDVIFAANDGVHGTELWVTNGTAGGTMLLKDIDPGSASGISVDTNPSSQEEIAVSQPVVVGSDMYFQANDGNGRNELWKTDGTTAGTVLVKSFNSDTTQWQPSNLVSFDGEVYFVGNGQAGFVEESSASGPQIWKSDGTASGTVQVTNIAASSTPDVSDGPADPFFLTVAGNNLFFDWYNGDDFDPTDKEQQLYVINNANPTGLQLTTNAIGEPANLTNINGELYFSMNDGVHGQELWKSDGTVAGTVLVDDIAPGGGGNNAPGSDPYDLTAFNGDVYFIANDGTDGDQIWKSDGTAGGTVMLTNFTNSSALYDPDLTVVGNTLFFAANDGTSGQELWEMNTSGNYNLVKDINPGAGGSSPSELTDIGGILYFGVQSSGDGNGTELWRSDGSSGGTYEVTNVYNYQNGFNAISYIPAAAPVPVVVTETYSDVAGQTVTGTSGTAGTGALAGDSDPGSLALSISAVTGGTVGSSVAGTYGHLTLNANGSYSYAANMASAIAGAPIGSHPIDSFTYTVSDTASNSSPATIEFTIDRAPNTLTHHTEVDVDQSTGTVSAQDTDPDGDGVTVTAISGGTVGTAVTGAYGALTIYANDTYSYTASNTAAIDATPVNVTPIDTFTYTVSDASGATATETLNIAVNRPSTVVPQLIFESYVEDTNSQSIYDGSQVSFELGTSTGAAGNGSVLDNVNQTTGQYDQGYLNSADPGYFTQLGSDVLFVADDGVHGTELWITDGTQNGTMLLKDIDPGSAGGVNSQPVVVGSDMYFAANDGNGPNELWKTDGSTGGTVLVKSFNAATTQSEPTDLVNFDGELYFVGNDQSGFVEETSASGPQIWKSDGTTLGTVQVTDIAASATPDPVDGPAEPFFLTVAGNNLFFDWYDGNDDNLAQTDQQLYVINNANPAGLELTTQAVGEPTNLTNVNGELYFSMDDGTHGQELWKSDGTVAGTVLIDDIASGSGGSNPFDITAFNGEVYFIANDGTHGYQIWKSDGTAGGTTMVTNFTNSTALQSSQITAVGNTLFFTANTSGSGNELWELDTTGDYNLVKDINPGSGSSNPSELTDIDGILYFGVNSSGDGAGSELWRSDGTAAGTYEVTNLYNYGSAISYVITAPVVTAGATVTYDGGGSAVTLDSGLTITDAASTTLESVTVSVANFVQGDELNFINQDGITGGYVSSTGVLTLSGTASLANYQAALDSITYSFSLSAGDPTEGGTEDSRTIDWVASDGTNSSTQVTSTVNILADAGGLPAPVDFYGNGTSDILFSDNATDDTGFYQIGSGAYVGWSHSAYSTGYSVVGTGDFTGNGTDDILFQNNSTGDFGFYQMVDGAFTGWHDIGVASTAYSVAGVGDFTGNGTDDILFRDSSTGDTGFYQLSNGATVGWRDIGGSATAYSVVGVGDFFSNGTDDFLFRDNATGDTGFYAISNGVNAGWYDIAPTSSIAYSVVGVGDFLGNGTDDVLFRDNANGDIGFYAISNGVNTGWHDIGGSSTAYSVVAVGNYLGNDTADILFRNATNGDIGFYAISDGVNIGWHDIATSNTAYHVVS